MVTRNLIITKGEEVSKEDKLRELEAQESRGDRMRHRLGLVDNSETENRVRDWLAGPGAVPAFLAVAALAIYLIYVVVSSLAG